MAPSVPSRIWPRQLALNGLQEDLYQSLDNDVPRFLAVPRNPWESAR